MTSLKKLVFISFLAVSILTPNLVNISFGALKPPASIRVISKPILEATSPIIITPSAISFSSPTSTPEVTSKNSQTIQPTNAVEPKPTPALTPTPVNSSEEIKSITPDLAKSDLAAVSDSISKINNKTGSVSNLESNFSKVKSDFASLRKNLVDKNLSPEILSRFDQFQSQYETQVSNINAKLQTGDRAESEIKNFLQKPEVKIENPTPFRAIEFKGQIKKVPVSEFPKTALQTEGDLIKNFINSAVLKTRDLLDLEKPITSSPKSQNFEQEFSQTSNIDPRTLSNILSPSDLEESEEIQFTENLKNLAVSLQNDPLTIFNYVANNIDYVPYFGSKKGADSTLLEKLGNDFDQASLLIGLLRVGDTNSQNQTPARYKQATIKLSVGEVIDLLGVEDPIVAATVFEKTDVPYVLYVDQSQTPLFFVIEVTYVEAYVDYDYTRGIVQGNPGAQKRWIPLVPFLAKFYKSQHLSALDKMNFDAETFFDNYLSGNYGTQEPIEALKSDIQTFIASDPDLTLEDTYVQTYRSEEDIEFLPLTLPFEIVSNLATFSAAPDNLKHKINFSVLSDDGTQNFLNTTVNVSSLADKELILDYVAATPADQAVIDSFPSIYDVIPLSLVNLKPALKINGVIQSGGGVSDPEIQMGRAQKLKIIFKSPKKDIGTQITEKVTDTV